MILGGDFNLVGSDRPLRLLQEGLDADGSDLSAADAYRLGDRSHYTWRTPTPTSFTPGRLDFILFSDSIYEEVGSFTFDAALLSRRERDRLGIADDDPLTSGHLPVVVDLSRSK